MLFDSFSFLVFFPVVVIGYYILPGRARWAGLLLASCYFYAVFVPAYLLVLGALIVVDYGLALFIEEASSIHKKRMYLALGITFTLGLLFVFKYFNFASENLSALASFIGWRYSVPALHLLLPLGLSFHTFQSISYLVEVRRGTQKAERHFGIYALFIMFFPQLLAGPIERAWHMLPQLHVSHALNWGNVYKGLRLMLWGFFLKLVIADRAAIFVDAYYANPSSHLGPASLLALVLFAFQLYGDFGGYTAIALGSAQVLGFELTPNFRQPYFSKSIAEFWQRWHMSLSSWLRDYVYVPTLASFRSPSLRALYISIIVTFLLSGLWHGAGWTFIGMGLFYGACIVLGLMTRRIRAWVVRAIGLEKLPAFHHFLQTLMTFALVCIGWLFFRAQHISVVQRVLGQLSVGWGALIHHSTDLVYLTHEISLGFPFSELVITATCIAVLVAVEYIQTHGFERLMRTFSTSIYVQTTALATLFLCVIIFGEYHSQAFIYFQF